MDPFFYPVNDFGPLMKGLVIGGLGIFHVFLAQFAIGGGFLMCYFQWLATRGRSQTARLFLDSYFKFLVLISFILGALTGVGMWFTSIQVSPQTIGLMVDEFHWLWAVEWTFFCVEVIAGYTFYRHGKELTDRARLTLLGLYTAAAWFSLFWINGILSWQLTPGDWLETRGVWAGFFNASFWPSLLYRTFASLSVAALVGMVVVNLIPTLEQEQRRELIHRAAWLLAPMALMPVLGIWFLGVLPADSREWVLGGSPLMTMFLNIAVGASLLIGLYAVIGLLRQKLYINGATASLLVVLALAATAGGEFVREGVRKPFTVREWLYSNAIQIDQVEYLRRVGGTKLDPYPLRDAHAYPTAQLRTGALVFRQQCSVCHTTNGVNGLMGLTATWDADQKRMNIAKLQQTKPFMPPFAGPAEEVEALVQYLDWLHQKRPAQWSDSTQQADAQERLQRIGRWLNEAGPRPRTQR